MRQASPSRLLTWGLYHPSPLCHFDPLFGVCAVFISFHFVRGLELNLLENASNSKFYEFTTFRLSFRTSALGTIGFGVTFVV